MNSLRRWLYRPKRSDQSLLAQFYFADEELNHVAAELDSFEGRGYPERCAALVNQLRSCQARVLNVVSQMMDESIKDQRALRDFRVKFPDDLCQENLAGQLWFGAECLAAGSSIMNKEVESACMRPLARALTKSLDSLRTILREQCLQNVNEYTEMITESLIIFDKLFAEFELSYVSAMAPVKTAHEYDMIQEITVLFSETVQRALKIGLLSKDMIDEYDPALMFTIPRLAIVCGTLIFKDGPLNPDNEPRNISEMFRPFQTLLHKIRELLSILTSEELNTLERALCSQDEPSFLVSLEEKRKQAREERRRKRKGKTSMGKVKRQVEAQEEDNGSIESELTAREIAERLEALALNFETSRNNSEFGAHGGTAENTPEAQHQNVEEHSPSASPSFRLVDDGSKQNQASVDNFETSCVLQDIDYTETVNLSGEMSAFLENPICNIPHPSLTDQMTIDSDDHTSHMSDLKCEIPSALNDKELDENDDTSLAKTNGAHSNELGRYELNKCDSNDSGLHSEVMSNSGSMFTISSSDSNQQITNSEFVSQMPDQSGTECIEDADSTESQTLDQARTECIEDADSVERGLPFMNQDDCPSDCQLKTTEDDDISMPSKDLSRSDDIDSEHIDHAPSQSPISEKSGLEQFLPSLPSHRNSNSEINSDVHAASSSLCPEELSSLISSSEEKSDFLLQQNSDILLKTNSENEDTVVSVVSESKAESLCKNQLEAEHFQYPDNKNDMTNSHACASTMSTEISSEPNHSPRSSLTSNDVCDISLPDVGQFVNSAKIYEEEGESLLCSASNTYHKDRINSISSETDSNSDTQSLSLILDSNLQSNQTDQEQRCENLSSKPLLPRKSSEIHPQSNNTFHHSPNEGGSLIALANGYTNNVLTKFDEKSHTSNSSTSPNISEHTVNNASANSSSSAHTSSSRMQPKKVDSKKTRHAGQKDLSRANRSGIQSHLSREKKTKLCAAHSKMMLRANQLDSDCYNSSETSSYTSDCGDQEEIALAIEAAENASRNNVRARFKSNSDMIHRLFVCISGVADQLQTNFAGDLRNILRSVFDMNCSEPTDKGDSDKPKDSTPLAAAYRAMSHAARASRHRHSSLRRQDPPMWLPDEECNECMACQVPFNFVRRRHHCRNCGKIFCGRCSSNYVPLPQFGQDKAVRVCNRCFMFQVTPFH